MINSMCSHLLCHNNTPVNTCLFTRELFQLVDTSLYCIMSSTNDRALATPTVAVPVSSGPLNAAIPTSPSQAKNVHISEHTIPQTPVIHPPIGKSVQNITRSESTGTPRAIGALPKHIPSKAGGLMQHLIMPNISESHHSIATHVSAFQPNKDCDDSDTSTTGDVNYTSILVHAIL